MPSLILVPMTIPSLLSAIAWIQLLDPRIGLVNVSLRAALGLSGDMGPLDIYSLGGMCFVQGLRLVPSAYLMIAASFRAMDPSLEEQSAMAGRNVAQTTLRVTLPIVRPALLAALIYYVIVVIESFDIPGLLGFTARIRVLSTAIYWATHSEVGLPDYGLASALGTIVLAVALFLMWIYHRLTGHQERFATITGKGYRPRQINLGRWTLPAFLFCLIYVLVAVVLPFVMLLWTSVQPFYAPPSVDSFGARDLRRLSKYLARRQRRSRRLEYHHYCFGHGGGDDCIVGSCELVCRAPQTRIGSACRLSRHGVVSTPRRAQYRHRPGAHLRLCSFPDSNLRHSVDHRFSHDHSLSRLWLARHDISAYPDTRRAGGSFPNVRGSLASHFAQDNGAAVGSGHDQCFFLGRGACYARAVDGADAIQSKHRGGFNDDLEHVAKRQDRGCCRIGRAVNFAFGSITFGRAALVLSEKKFLPITVLRP